MIDLGKAAGAFSPVWVLNLRGSEESDCGAGSCGSVGGVFRLGDFRFENDGKVGGGSGAHFPFPLQLTGQIPEKIYTQ